MTTEKSENPFEPWLERDITINDYDQIVAGRWLWDAYNEYVSRLGASEDQMVEATLEGIKKLLLSGQQSFLLQVTTWVLSLKELGEDASIAIFTAVILELFEKEKQDEMVEQILVMEGYHEKEEEDKPTVAKTIEGAKEEDVVSIKADDFRDEIKGMSSKEKGSAPFLTFSRVAKMSGNQMLFLAEALVFQWPYAPEAQKEWISKLFGGALNASAYWIPYVKDGILKIKACDKVEFLEASADFEIPLESSISDRVFGDALVIDGVEQEGKYFPNSQMIEKFSRTYNRKQRGKNRRGCSAKLKRITRLREEEKGDSEDIYG